VREIKLLIDPPASGDWNMAVDEALLEAAANGTATLRLYQWTPATLSLGYFQAAALRQSHSASLACPLVRRASGGGAILHDRELTYSLALPQPASKPQTAAVLYDSIHDSLIAALAEFDVVATRHGPAGGSSSQPRQNAAEPFLCFQRRAQGDILCGEHKIVGSAQRRRRGAVLQHGSILLARSLHAPELPGIEELSGASLPRAAGGSLLSELISAWLPRLTARLRASFQSWELPPSIESRAKSLLEARFGSAAFTHQR